MALALTPLACSSSDEEPTHESASSTELPITSTHACYERLSALGFTEEELTAMRAFPAPTSSDAVRVPAVLRGVTFRYNDTSNRTGLVVGCELASAVLDIAKWASARGITDILHLGGYYNRTVAGRTYESQHAFARAFDIRGIVKAGRTYSVARDYEATEGNDLYDLGRMLPATAAFTILGPGYDPDHGSHFHVELEGCLCEGLQLAPCTPENIRERPFCRL